MDENTQRSNGSLRRGYSILKVGGHDGFKTNVKRSRLLFDFAVCKWVPSGPGPYCLALFRTH
jgi:hypothetical protein